MGSKRRAATKGSVANDSWHATRVKKDRARKKAAKKQQQRAKR